MTRREMKRTRLATLILLIFLSLSFLFPSVHGAYFIESFEDGITDFWVKEQQGSGSLTTTTQEHYHGNVAVNATAFGGGTYYQFVWTDNFTSSWQAYNYMGYAIKLDADLKLADTKSLYVSAMWDEAYTWSYVHLKNVSGTLKWYPDSRGYYGTIQLDTWYFVCDAYFINASGGSGWERFYVWNEGTDDWDLLMDYESDTSWWNHTQGISVGMMNVYGTGADGGSAYFDYACITSSQVAPQPSVPEVIDIILGHTVAVMGASGLVMLVFAPLVFIKKKKNLQDAFTYVFVMGILGFGFVVVWLWG